MDFPSQSNQFNKPTLFIGGSRGGYITQNYFPAIKHLFPKAQIEMLDAGHWVHSEKPKEFMDLVTKFIKNNNNEI